jgi:tetraacyldisaccharide 4'-kinase
MKRLRILLYPFALLYGAVVAIRNAFYDKGIFSSYIIPKKSIVVGNLSAGGTGKTPLVDYILDHFKSLNTPTSVLSRGYGRATKGVLIADSNSTSAQIGDEPLLYQNHHGENVYVVVAEKRQLGVEKILSEYPENELIVLDDAFQHRAVTAGLNILVTQFNDLYCDDHVLPAGNLREFKTGAKRADILIISKCPQNLDDAAKKSIVKRINFPGKHIFFSSIEYGELVPFDPEAKTEVKNILLVTGIGNPSPLIDQLSRFSKVEHLAFKDHHDFTASDIELIHDKFGKFASDEKIIVTTEKDFMRLKKFEEVYDASHAWFYQPIKIEIDQQKTFNNLLDEYVGKI